MDKSCLIDNEMYALLLIIPYCFITVVEFRWYCIYQGTKP